MFLNGTVTNDSDGWLYYQTSTSYVRYHTLSNTRIQQKIRKIKSGGNGESEKKFLYKNNMQELCIIVYVIVN